MYKHDTLFFYPFIFICFFFLVYIILILLLTYDKGHRLRTFYIYSIYIKFGIKSLIPKAVTLAGGIREPLLTCSSFIMS